MAKVFTITVPPKLGNKRRERTSDPRYVDGQRLLVEAMKYLAQADPVRNRSAIELISEHVRTRFRMSDSPLGKHPPAFCCLRLCMCGPPDRRHECGTRSISISAVWFCRKKGRPAPSLVETHPIL